MQEQNYKNHIRFYPLHHFIFYPVVTILIVLSFYLSSQYEEQKLIWIAIGILLIIITWLSLMLRQHYALTAQDRTVRVEMRYRYFALTGKRLELLEPQLSLGQILALRFASDEELPVLLQKAIDQNLSADEIKRSIKNWQPDYMRV
ncbi:DUF6526 family protein [Emticicia sp. 17c]|uniref:DUF6526 family protein n=1 Tax=Emticicia sp. 17c TaxID=3127704 RepID=UPI00301B9636